MRDARRNKTKPQRISLQMAEQSRMKQRQRSLQMAKQSKQTLVTVRIYWILATIGYLLVLFLYFMIPLVSENPIYSLGPVFDFAIFAIIGIVGSTSFYYWHKSAYERYKHHERHNKIH